MTPITADQLPVAMENVFQRIIDKARLHSGWDEDYISRRLICKLSNFLNGLVVSGSSISQTIYSSAWKLSGKNESHHGDIGVLVKISRHDGTQLEGFGFLEAKKRFTQSGQFDSLKFDQLDRIRSNTALGYLLLYDYQAIPKYAPNLECWLPAGFFISGKIPCIESSMVVIPLSTAIPLEDKTTTLYSYCYPLTNQFISRFMRGYDLDTREEIVNPLKSSEVIEGMPTFLIHIEVNESPSGEGGSKSGEAGRPPKPDKFPLYEKCEPMDDDGDIQHAKKMA